MFLNCSMRVILACILSLICIVSKSQNTEGLTQNIRGKVADAVSKSGLPGVQLMVFKDSVRVGAATTDSTGRYRISNVPVGRVSLSAGMIGYQSAMFNLDVNSGKESILNFDLEESAVEVNEVVIEGTTKGDVRNEMALISAKAFTVEETERYAGSRSDPARMASNFAGVQGADDSRNDIIIRGNSPLGLLWRFEGVDIPNPNHFYIAGSTGGPVNIINNKVLDNSDFFTGAFPAEYGNSNAGVFDLKMRNGNNEQHEFTGQFGFLGTELSAEGPLEKTTGSSYLLSYRYATLKLFETMNIQIGTSAVPRYQDLAFKLNFPGKRNDNFSIFGVGGTSGIDIVLSDQTEPTQEIYSEDDRDQHFGSAMGVTGMSYQKSVNSKTYFKIVAAHSGNTTHSHHLRIYRDSSYTLDSLSELLGYRFDEEKSSLNIYVNHKFSNRTSLRTGLLSNYYKFDFLDSIRNQQTWGFYKRLDYHSGTGLIQPFVQFRVMTSDKFLFTSGLFAQYLHVNGSSSIEPRFSMQWRPSADHSISYGFGMHSQMLPTYTYFAHLIDTTGKYVWHNKGVGFSRSLHNVVGYNAAFSKTMRFKTEVYYQYLYEIPVEIKSSSFSMVNQGSGFDRFFPDSLQNTGTGKNYGLEVTLEKYFSKSYFFMLTASVFDSKYKGSDGVERNTDFNGSYAVNALLAKEFKMGAKKNSVLTTGSKITWAGGKRYSPADTAASAVLQEYVPLDSMRNTLQFKDYFRWDIKLGFKANRSKVTHEIGIDLVNVLGIENVLGLTYVANAKTPEESIREEYQLGFLPLFYYKIDF